MLSFQDIQVRFALSRFWRITYPPIFTIMAAWRWKYIRYSPIYLYLPTAQIKCVLHKIELKKKKKKYTNWNSKEIFIGSSLYFKPLLYLNRASSAAWPRVTSINRYNNTRIVALRPPRKLLLKLKERVLRERTFSPFCTFWLAPVQICQF